MLALCFSRRYCCPPDNPQGLEKAAHGKKIFRNRRNPGAHQPASDDRGDGDEPAAVDDVGLELVDLAEHEEGATEAGRQPAQEDRLAAPGVDLDAGDVGCFRPLADGADLQSPPGPVDE